MFPVAVRTRNRPAYCDVMLKSLMASALPPDFRPPVVIDDCSDDPVAKRYVETDDVIDLPVPLMWQKSPEWLAHVGRIRNVRRVRGIRSKFEVVRPDSRKGERGGAFWSVCFLFERFPDAQAAFLFEDDIVFNPGWLAATMRAYEGCRDKHGPNGSRIGLLTAYDRRNGSGATPGTGWGWRSLRSHGDGRWGCGDGIGGVFYLISRQLYEENRDALKEPHDPSGRGGDTRLQGMCANRKFNIAVTAPSYCQHIGDVSLAWAGKGWRHTKNFLKPFAFEKFDDKGEAYSDDWL